ncbi:MAG: hypothetical protein OXD45_07230 [Rhodobacteraceae bacterium]|nr:hypothetical protein [Paracoccaceae bacterium]
MPIRKTIFDHVTQQNQSGVVMDIVSANEPMLILKLNDGAEVRIKHTITEVIKLDIKDNNGEPVYSFTTDIKAMVYPKEGD